MARKSFRDYMLASQILLASIGCVPMVEAKAAKTTAPRCSYAYIAAAARVAALISSQIQTANGEQQIAPAQTAVQLVRELSCPIKPMLQSIDCAVDKVRNTGGEMPDGIMLLQCVETATRQTFPKLKNP